MATFRVNGPNGELYEVTAPEDASHDQVIAYAQSRAKPAKAKRSLTQDVTGFMANVNRGLGVGDEMAAGIKTAGNALSGKVPLSDVGGDFQRNMLSQRATEDSYTEAHPHASALAKGTGNAFTMAAPAGPGAAAFSEAVPLIRGAAIPAGKAVNALRGATVAGLSGAGFAAVDRGSLGERAQGAGRAARDPLTLGVGAVAGRMATPGRGPKPKAAPAPTLDELTAQKTAAYKAVDESGHRFSPKDFNTLTENMAQAMDAEGFNAGLHKKAAAMLDAIGTSKRKTRGYSPTLSQLDQLRQQIGRDVAASPDPGERRMGAIMRDQIDAFIEAQGKGSDLIQSARNLNTRVQKIRSLDNLDVAAEDRAAVTGSGGNVNNATRQNVLRFRNNTGNLTPEEEAAANKVIRGTPAGNALRLAGKLSPGGNGLMAAGHLAAIIPTHGASAAVGIGGVVAKLASDAITARNVGKLRDLIARGGKEAAQEVSRQLADPQYAELRAQLANDLSVAAGVQGASSRGAVPARR